ncbi:MAG: HK97 gp10 family phage protein [Novosphingobium meiothermophilum]
MAGRVKGVGSLRRLLRRLPDAARMELSDELQAIGKRLTERAKAETPVKTGRLRAALNFKATVKGLQLRLGLIKKADQRRFFYGYILDAGRKAKVVKARRRRADGSYSTYTINVKAIPASRYDFVFGRRKDFQVNEIPKLRTVLDRVLTNAARGAGND